MTEASLHILIALAAGDAHGYALMRDIAAQTGGRVDLYPGTLYANIKRLVEQDFVQERDERLAAQLTDERRRCYRITRTGRKALKAELERLQSILRYAQASGVVVEREA
jgi:DNA-binding PadR family transcriptional regulator